MIESIITSRGRTTLPKAVREALSVRSGDRLRYAILDGQVRIMAVRPVSRLFGVLRHRGPAVTLEEMDHAIASGLCFHTVATQSGIHSMLRDRIGPCLKPTRIGCFGKGPRREMGQEK